MKEGTSSLKIRCLEQSTDKIELITFPPRELIVIDILAEVKMLTNQQYSQLRITSSVEWPQSKNFAVADGFLPPDVFIQVTVSPHHGLKTWAAQKIVETLLERDPTLDKIKVYFMVPPDIFPHFSKQNFVNLSKASTRQRTLPSIVSQKLEQWVVYFDL